MTSEERESLIEGALARALAERVVEKLLERQKRALVVYTGSDLGFSTALEELCALRKEGFTYRVLLTPGAGRILDRAAICAALEPEALWVGEPPEPPEVLTERYDTILAPALTVNTAAHVASCMADTPAAALLLNGLMRGKNVVAAVDGCCPDNRERAARGFHMAEPLKERLRGNLETLRAYGARLTGSDGLRQKTLRAIGEIFPAAGPEEAPPPAATGGARGEAVLRLEGRVLSGRQVRAWPSHSRLRVPRGTLITQLAADEARRRDIQIEREG